MSQTVAEVIRILYYTRKAAAYTEELKRYNGKARQDLANFWKILGVTK